jgi:hypothetical protein
MSPGAEDAVLGLCGYLLLVFVVGGVAAWLDNRIANQEDEEEQEDAANQFPRRRGIANQEDEKEQEGKGR